MLYLCAENQNIRVMLTKFAVKNGGWIGTIVTKDDQKYVEHEKGIVPITDENRYSLDIEIFSLPTQIPTYQKFYNDIGNCLYFLETIEQEENYDVEYAQDMAEAEYDEERSSGGIVSTTEENWKRLFTQRDETIHDFENIQKEMIALYGADYTNKVIGVAERLNRKQCSHEFYDEYFNNSENICNVPLNDNISVNKMVIDIENIIKTNIEKEINNDEYDR